MNWLKEHVFLATWLAPIITIAIAVLKSEKSEGGRFEWFPFILYFTFFICLAVLFTPEFDELSRTTARTLVMGLLGAILVYKKGL